MIDISRITDSLYIGSEQHHHSIEELKLLKIDLIISMIGQREPPEIFDDPPFRLLWLKAYDTFLTPVPIKKLTRGVLAAVPIIQAGGRVLVFCRQGRRRSVTMAVAILIALGYTAKEAAALIKEQRMIANPGMWYVHRRIIKFERHWDEEKDHFQQRIAEARQAFKSLHEA